MSGLIFRKDLMCRKANRKDISEDTQEAQPPEESKEGEERNK